MGGLPVVSAATRFSAASIAMLRRVVSEELAMCGVPSVLVPLPIATQDHQRHNAMSLVRRGAAELILDADLTVDRLEQILLPIVTDAERRADMAEAAANVVAGEAGVERGVAQLLGRGADRVHVIGAPAVGEHLHRPLPEHELRRGRRQCGVSA